jgi:hypothetical protein
LGSIAVDFDNSYKGDEIQQKCAQILGLKNVRGWSVVDTEEHLALLHYVDDADLSTVGHIRGMLVDLEAGAVIADSFGYTPTSVSSELIPVNDRLTIVDTESTTHVFNLNECVIKRVFEGVVIRVIWHKSKLYKITHKKINSHRSRWGSSRYFVTMYEEAGGPTAEQLFDTTKPYSNTCYEFLVVDQSLLVGTRQKVTKPYIVCLAQRTMEINRPDDEVAPGVPTFTTDDTICGLVDIPLIHDPQPLSLKEANDHLKFGYYNEFVPDDKRLMTGEAVLVYKMVDGVISDIVKVHSPSFDWRVNLRGNNPNIVNQFYSLLNTVYPDITSDSQWDSFKSKFIVFPLYDEASLRELYTDTGAILGLPIREVSRSDYANIDSRIYLLWLNYLVSLPPHLQSDGLDIYNNFVNDRDDLINWIQCIEASNKDIDSLDYHRRVKALIKAARNLSRDRINSGNNYSSNGSYMKLSLVIKNVIRNLINKENGPSLYTLVREMKKSRNPRPVDEPVEQGSN